jgi:hypothetical protein
MKMLPSLVVGAVMAVTIPLTSVTSAALPVVVLSLHKSVFQLQLVSQLLALRPQRQPHLIQQAMIVV